VYLSVGQVARALGVTPDTVRRWTSTGFLPCERTAGGHRRIAGEDVDELRRAIGGGGHLEARRAREREVDTLAQASIDLAGMLDRQKLLATIARHVTRLCDCSTCAISSYDPEAQTVSMLAEYDARGRRMPSISDFSLSGYPVTLHVLERQVAVVVNVDDKGADPAEVALLREYGDKSVLMVPLVFQGQTMGLLEATDWERARRYSPQELRLVQALAGNAAVALRNVALYDDALGGRDRSAPADARLRDLADRLASLGELRREDDWPNLLARLACDLFEARSCLVVRDGEVAGAAVTPASGRARTDRGHDAASVLTSVRTGSTGRWEVTLSLLRSVEPGEEGPLAVVAALAAGLG
jgi:excisionase family DNA binding protein